MVELEQNIVHYNFVGLEPIEKAADKGQPVDSWSRHAAGSVSGGNN